MNRLGSLLRFDFVPLSTDAALLVLRIWVGLSMLMLHGMQKLTNFHKFAGGFPDPLNIGNRNSLGLAVFGEVLCQILIVIGLFTRFAALSATITMAVAFFIVHKASLKPGPGSGEMAFLYLCAYVVLFLAGAGRYALDGTKGGSAPKKFKPSKE